MSAREKKPEEPKKGAPAFIVTFSDMITLLLTFFVMLLSLAEEQVNDHKFMIGAEAVSTAFSTIGLSGALTGKGSGPDFDHPKPKYKVPEDQSESTRKEMDTKSKDHHTEMLRRIVMEIERKMKVSPPQLTGTSKTFDPSPIRFADGGWKLDDAAKSYLDDFNNQMQESLGGEDAIIYVVGLADSEGSDSAKWTVSAKRAQAVADYLRAKIPESVNWSLYSWGSGSGGDWTSQESGFVDKTTQIMIASLVDEEKP